MIGSHYTRLISFSLWVIMILIIAGCSLSTNYSGPPIDLIMENVNSTDETVVLEVEGMTKVQEDDSYATWKINATVVKSFKGKLTSRENIEYFSTVETDLETTQQGSPPSRPFRLEKGTLLSFPQWRLSPLRSSPTIWKKPP